MARFDEPADLRFEPLRFFGELGELRVHESEHRIGRWTPRIGKQREHLADFLDVEALTPTAQDDSKALKMMALEVTVGARPRHAAEQPLLGVIADRLDRHPKRRRGFTDEHTLTGNTTAALRQSVTSEAFLYAFASSVTTALRNASSEAVARVTGSGMLEGIFDVGAGVASQTDSLSASGV